MGQRVVVVDDDRELREALRDALEDAGYEVHVVPNGLRLLRVLAISRPDVILLDVMMSWIDGVGLCEALKQNPQFSEIPVVFVSARTDLADIRRGMAAGAVDYVTKPFELGALLERIDRVIHPREQRAAPS
jgi:DNA-binding response OmpR family regulator